MPYKNIHWIKLEKRLLNDPRFFLMSEKAQLYYIKILLLCAEYKNKIPKNYPVLRELLRTKCNEDELNKIINEIKNNLPKVVCNKHFYYVRGFKEHHNWVFPRSSQGVPGELVDKNKIKKEILDKIIQEYIRQKHWDVVIKNNPSILTEIYERNSKSAKRLYIALNKDEKKTCEFICNFASYYQQRGLDWTLETILKHLPKGFEFNGSVKNTFNKLGIKYEDLMKGVD